MNTQCLNACLKPIELELIRGYNELTLNLSEKPTDRNDPLICHYGCERITGTT